MQKSEERKSGKLIQHRLNFVSTCFNKVGRGEQEATSTSLFNRKIERMLRQMSKLFASAPGHVVGTDAEDSNNDSRSLLGYMNN